QNKNSPWLSVPQFGDWDQKGGPVPDYSMDFSKIREMRKQHKRDPSRASLGNEQDFINPFHNQPTSVDKTKAKLTTVHSDNNITKNEFPHHQRHPPSVLTEFLSRKWMIVFVDSSYVYSFDVGLDFFGWLGYKMASSSNWVTVVLQCLV
ncbi:unnamed protein product, partial [Brassica oleracea var. botrytis]